MGLYDTCKKREKNLYAVKIHMQVHLYFFEAYFTVFTYY